MPETTTTSIDDAVRKYVAESRYVMQERPGVIFAFLRSENLPKGQGSTVNIPKYGTVNTTALTEGVDMASAQEITDTNTALTPSEYGGQVILTDMMLDTVKDEFFRVAGKLLGEGFDRQREQTLADDMANFSVIIGSAGTALNVGHVMAGYASIKYNAPAAGVAGRGGEPAPDPVALFQTPAAIHSLRKSMVGHVAGAVVQASGGTASMGAAPSLGGAPAHTGFMVDDVTVHSSINFNKDTSDDVVGGLLSKEGIITATLGGGPDAEKERDSSLRAWELNFVGRWGRVEYNDAWGRAVTMDSALPGA
ncbi:MAG TPA: hypothetical protein VFH61_14190 [Thermoleophilia bacterium]|nr:hypothetical protein [Thermoleophilia bacterium]